MRSLLDAASRYKSSLTFLFGLFFTSNKSCRHTVLLGSQCFPDGVCLIVLSLFAKLFSQCWCRLLNPDLECSGSLFAGKYILQLILHLPSEMSPHVQDLVAALVRRMQSAEISGFRSSLLLIFARLVFFTFHLDNLSILMVPLFFVRCCLGSLSYTVAFEAFFSIDFCRSI